MRPIQDRLDDILPKITHPAFRKSTGLGNEVGYYVFDYDPKAEMLVRDHIAYLKERINGDDTNDLRIVECDLYEIILDVLNKKGYLEKNFAMEKQRGSAYVLKATTKTLRLTQPHDQVIGYIKERVKPGDIVFITGVGKAFPFIRSHTVLNNMYKAADNIPVVLFFPGKYDGQELSLFGEIKDDNYYRAFPLVDE